MVTYEIQKGTNENPIDYFFRAYYENGELMKEGKFVNYKEQGEWKYYYETGRMSSKGNFENGNRKGEFTRYYDTGELEQEGNYENNVVTSIKFYYRNGKEKTIEIIPTEFVKLSAIAWTNEQLDKIRRRLKQEMRYNANYNPEFCDSLISYVSHHVDFEALDTLTDYERAKIYGLFIMKDSTNNN